MNSKPRESALRNAVIVEAVALVEQAGPLEDAQLMRELAQQPVSDTQRIEARALALGRRIGLQDELDRARTWAPWVGLALAVAIAVASLGLAGSVTGERDINVVVALAALLGFHLITLGVWGASLVLPAVRFRSSLGGAWMALTARVAGGRRGQAPLLLRAATRMLVRTRLLPWALGFVSHAIWTLSFAVVLGALLFALAFRNYTLSWESTILEPVFFAQGVRLLGWLPSMLGFPVPDAQAVLANLPTAADQRQAALWLAGCLLSYGLLPRAALALGCAAVWRMRQPALRQPDRSGPDYQKMLTRFGALAPGRVVDADRGRHVPGLRAGLSAQHTTFTRVAIAFELPAGQAWPPRALAAPAWTTLRIDGSGDQRRALLDQLIGLRPQLVVIACNAMASPDRGTARFLRDVSALCGECRVWLVAGGGVPDVQASQRWHAWLAESGLARMRASGSLATLLPGTAVA